MRFYGLPIKMGKIEQNIIKLCVKKEKKMVTIENKEKSKYGTYLKIQQNNLKYINRYLKRFK